MTRPRGRPASGAGVSRADILQAALALLDEGGGEGLTMRALGRQLGVTAMSLYRHVGDHDALLRSLSDQVDAQVLEHAGDARSLLTAYYQAVGGHPQLALAIFAAPEAFAGVTRQITDRLTALQA